MAYVFNPFTGTLDYTRSVTAATIYTEIPVGAIDGVNATYTVAHSISYIITFGINGELIHPYNASFNTASKQYTFSGTTITIATALPADLSDRAFTITYISSDSSGATGGDLRAVLGLGFLYLSDS